MEEDKILVEDKKEELQYREKEIQIPQQSILVIYHLARPKNNWKVSSNNLEK